jgi:hypothetical protein
MGLALRTSRYQYSLLVRCSNCLKDKAMAVVIYCEGIPRQCDLEDSEELQSLRYECERCGSLIGQVVGVSGGSQV